MRRIGASEESMLVVQANIANSYLQLGRTDDSLRMNKAIYAGNVRLFGDSHEKTLLSALTLSISLVKAGNASESRTFSRPLLPVARRVLGADHENTLRLAHAYVYAVLECAAAARDELIFAEKLLEDTARRFRRVFGTAHPNTARAEKDMAKVRYCLAKP